MSEETINRVYEYIIDRCKLGVHPHQLAKALNMNETVIMEALKELERQGRIRLRSANIEWRKLSKQRR